MKILTFETIVARLDFSIARQLALSFRGEHNPIAAVSGLIEAALAYLPKSM